MNKRSSDRSTDQANGSAGRAGRRADGKTPSVPRDPRAPATKSAAIVVFPANS
jgi:hypothetical protein